MAMSHPAVAADRKTRGTTSRAKRARVVVVCMDLISWGG